MENNLHRAKIRLLGWGTFFSAKGRLGIYSIIHRPNKITNLNEPAADVSGFEFCLRLSWQEQTR